MTEARSALRLVPRLGPPSVRWLRCDSNKLMFVTQVPAVELLLRYGIDAKAKTHDDLTILGITSAYAANTIPSLCLLIVRLKLIHKMQYFAINDLAVCHVDRLCKND